MILLKKNYLSNDRESLVTSLLFFLKTGKLPIINNTFRELYVPGKFLYIWYETPNIYYFYSHYFFMLFFAGLMNAVNDTFYASVFYITKVYFDSILIEFNHNIKLVRKKKFESEDERGNELLQCFKTFVQKHCLLLEHCSKLESVFLHYASLKVSSSMLIMAMNANVLVLV